MTAAAHRRRRRAVTRAAARITAITIAAGAVCALIILRVWLARVGN